MDASGRRLAGIVRAKVAIVALKHGIGLTPALVAGLVHGAGVAVIAGRLVRRKGASQPWLAAIVGADIAILARKSVGPGCAHTALAGIAHGARVFVGAGHLKVCVHATCSRFAAVGGAKIVVVTIERLAANADSPAARGCLGAGISIVAIGRVVLEDASGHGIAAIVRAGIAIVAHKVCRPRDTTPARAGIAHGAHVPIVAGLVVLGRHASKTDIADVCGAKVSIFADDLFAHTGPFLAAVFLGAGVGVVAAPLGGIVDTSLLAAGIVGAGIVIVAGQGCSTLAGSVGAEVSEGAGVSVIARQHHRLKHALPVFTAAIRRARISVVAHDWKSDAHTVLANIRGRARIPVRAFSVHRRFVDASIGPGAAIDGAWIAIVAGSIVDRSVAIVVNAIADFLGGLGGRTGT